MANTFINNSGTMERKIQLTPDQVKDIETPKATLVNPVTGDRKAIVIGSQGEKDLFSQGYVLEGAGKAPEKPATFANTANSSISAGMNKPEQQNLMSSQYKPLVNTYNGGTGVYSGNTPGTLPGASSGSTINAGTGSEMSQADMFNQLMYSTLQKSQGVDTLDLLKKKRALQRAQYGTIGEATPEELRTLSPSQQASIRSGKASTYRPDMDETEYQIARAQKAIDNFEDMFYKNQAMGQEFIDKMALPDSMIQNYVKVIEANPENMSTVLSTLNDKSKQAVISQLDYTKMTAKAASELPSIAQEYEYAKSQGYEGSFMDYQNEKSGKTTNYNGAPDITKIGNNSYIWDEDSQQFIPAPISDIENNVGEKYSTEAINWAEGLLNGTVDDDDLSTIPSDIRSEANSAYQDMKKQGLLSKKDKGVIDALKNKQDEIKWLIDNLDKGGDAVTGSGFMTASRILNPLSTVSGQAKDYALKLKTLVSRETLDTLVNLKASGGTLGAVSEKELDMLRAAGTAIASSQQDRLVGNLPKFELSANEVKNQLQKMYDASVQAAGVVSGLKERFDNLNTGTPYIDAVKKYGEDGLKRIINTAEQEQQQSFSKVGSDTNKATTIQKVAKTKEGSTGGQCGRYVNNITGLGVGDSYKSKLDKMDPTITQPEPGMVFVMPYKDTGHIGFVVGLNGNNAIVRDSNWSLDEKVKTHEIPISFITGLRRV